MVRVVFNVIVSFHFELWVMILGVHWPFKAATTIPSLSLSRSAQWKLSHQI